MAFHRSPGWGPRGPTDAECPQDLDYPIELDLGVLVPGHHVVARGVRLDGAALTLYFVLLPGPDQPDQPGRDQGACGPHRLGCRYRPEGPTDDGAAPRQPMVVALSDGRGRGTFPPPADADARVRFDIRPWTGADPAVATPGYLDPGGVLCLDLHTGGAVFAPAGPGPT